MMGWSPRCYIPSFVEISLPVLEKKIFEGFFTIYGRGGHLGHVTRPKINQRTNGPVNAHLISWPSKAQNIQNLENIW